jgi:tRNA 2-thiocytidine biosynthesis protein TtcA
MARRYSKKGAIISKKMGHAIKTYSMIEEGDLIMVGVSGGKDSLTLLKMLSDRRHFAPVKFDLHAVHIQPQFKKNIKLANYIQELCTEFDVGYTIKDMNIEVKDNESNCFWCSWNRRKIMFDLAEEMKIKKIALGHHIDDIIETTLLNMFFVGDFSTMNPSQPLFDGGVTMIRPMAYCREKDIAAFAEEYNFKEIEGTCEFKGESQRAYIKSIIADLEKKTPQVKTNIFRSMSRIKYDYIDLREE